MRLKARKSLEGRDGHGRPGPLRRHEVSWGSGEDVSTRSLRGSHGRAFRGGRYLPVGWPGVGISARSGLEEVVHKPSAIFGTFEGVHRQVNAKDRRAKLRLDAGPVRLPRAGRPRAKQKTGSSPTWGQLSARVCHVRATACSLQHTARTTCRTVVRDAARSCEHGPPASRVLGARHPKSGADSSRTDHSGRP